MTKPINQLALALPMLAMAGQAWAYIGPGAGISVVGSLLGILATFFVAIGAILFWPVRKLLKRRKARGDAAQSGANSGGDDGPGGGRRP